LCEQNNVERFNINSTKKFIYVLMYEHWSNSKKERKFIHLSFNLLIVILICDWSLNSFVDVHIDCVEIDQRFQNRECLAFDHEVNRIVDLCICFISVIFRRSYNYRKLITSIISRFFCVVSSLIKQSYNDFESMQSTKETRRSRMLNSVALKAASRSKSWASAYNFAARTLRVTRLHLIDDQ
jgi:hypothetical protein